ncbi:MAG TPA: hypothetical protein VFB96_03955 [Pirellulaceae bacterium]|nr:hypothetical protein [Pirellulaceae bacterium]
MLPTLSAAGLKLDGQGGTNTLDYSAYTSDIYAPALGLRAWGLCPIHRRGRLRRPS